MNKRGHLPTVLLLVTALILVGVVAFSFATFKGGVEDESKGLHLLVSTLNFQEEYVRISFKDMVEDSLEKAKGQENFELAFNNSLENIADERRDVYFGNFFGKIVNKQYVVNKEGGVYVLQVSDVFVRSFVDKNEIKRNFDLSLRFNENEVIE